MKEIWRAFRDIKKLNIFMIIVIACLLLVYFVENLYLRIISAIFFVILCSFLGHKYYKCTACFLDALILDELTGVYNYRYFMMRLEEEIQRYRRYGRPLVLAFIDCDNFKEFNDKYGHLEGNKALARLGHILKTNTRACDIVSRFGGDEFVIILPETNLISARVVMERVRNITANTCFTGSKGEITLTISLVNYDGEKLEDFIRRADTVLYKGKRDKKNNIVIQESTGRYE